MLITVAGQARHLTTATGDLAADFPNEISFTLNRFRS